MYLEVSLFCKEKNNSDDMSSVISFIINNFEKKKCQSLNKLSAVASQKSL